MGDGQEMPAMGRALSERDKELPDLPSSVSSPLSPSPVSPEYQ